ncbi:Lovastatin diketide synthase LovF [Cytospora mali]|uniref:Lovastatin diketide synthase LovF n=1 Tax=Cytospora mali TaxID=578113 RepID=A0A194W779_CYTMA|nr:Lovastatin diketide synthase LovF [Valsa mali]
MTADDSTKVEPLHIDDDLPQTNGVNGDDGEVPATTPNLDDGHSTSRNAADKTGPMQVMEPMAICGMACRLPGGITSPESLWKFLIEKRDARSRVPESRYNTDAYSSKREKPGTTRTDYGYFIDDDLRSFDPSCFHMSVKELERCDPQQRLMLLVARECVDDAGETDIAGNRIGVYVGVSQRGWWNMYEKETQNYGTYHLLGLDDFTMSNRVSYEMDLKGPSMTLSTACAGSLSALSEACKAIQMGECESAIVGGVNLILGTSVTIMLGEQGALSPDGSSRSFSADANGYARAEAVNACYVKPLSAALRDGNPVRAVIRSVVTNHTGRCGAITAPNIAAQKALVQQAYAMAGIDDYSDTPFVELHGTGTPVGDPIEAEAVGSLFGNEKGTYIGAIKPNLGHSESGSGLTSLFKAVLALEHKTIPPNIKFTAPNPKIPFKEYNLTVPVDSIPWPAGRKERVSVNNFGIGGVSAHVIVDSADSFDAGRQLYEAGDDPQLLVFSAHTPESARAMADRYSAYVTKNPERVEDLAYTLANRREHLKHRGFVVATRERPGVPAPLTKPPSGPAPGVVMVFSGQGAQWPQMGKELMRSNQVFKTSIQAMDAYLQKKLGEARPDWTIQGELKKPPKTSRIALAEFSQPLCTAVQIALVDALRAVGIEPAAVVGHSSGEIAGAYAAGALSREEAIVAAYHRGAIAQKQTRPGTMAAIGLSWEEVEEFLVPNVGVACENSPRSVTLSGDADEVAQVVESISKARPDVLARLLKVDKAYHSYHMAEVGPIYFDLVGPDVTGKAPAKPFFSSVEGRLLTKSDELGAHYWQKNLESPVLFKDAVLAIARHSVGQNAVFLEVGPHSALAGPLRQILADYDTTSQAPYIAAMLRGTNSTETLLSAIGKLYTLHVPVNLKALYPKGVALPNLPAYPWNLTGPFWHETRVMREWRNRQFKHHDLLGARALESSDLEPTWRNIFHLDNAPWVKDHVIKGDITFPFAAYVAMAGEAIRQVTSVEQGFRLRNVVASGALVMTDPDKPVELITGFRRRGDDQWWEFTIASHNGLEWTQHVRGEASALTDGLGPAAAVPELPHEVDAGEYYNKQDRAGLSFGHAFRAVDGIRTWKDKSLATVHNDLTGEESDYHVHPSAVENVFHLLSLPSQFGLGGKPGLNIVTSVGDISVVRCAAKEVAAHATARTAGNGSWVIGDVQGVVDGQTVLRMSKVAINVLQDAGSRETHAAARHIWGPHVDFAEPRKLLQSTYNDVEIVQTLDELTEMGLLYVQQTLTQLGNSASAVRTTHKYRDWIAAQLLSTSYAHGDLETLLETINQKATILSHTSASDVAQTIAKVTAAARDVVLGIQDAGDVLAQGDALGKTCDFIDSEVNRSALLRTIAHTKPNLRILELGGGSGRLTEAVLESLQGCYSRYTFTDASKNLVADAKESFKDKPNLEVVAFDIGADLEASGFAEGSGNHRYDLIIATNVLHKVDDLDRSLRNVHALLRPGGRLLLQELAPVAESSGSPRWVDFVFGILPAWWPRTTEDSHIRTPRTLNVAEWQAALKAAHLDTTVLGAVGAFEAGSKEQVLKLNNVFLSQVASTAEDDKASSKQETKQVAILTAEVKHMGLSDAFAKHLTAKGYDVSHITLNDSPPANRHVIALLDREDRPFLTGMSAQAYEHLQQHLLSLTSTGNSIFWVTGSSAHHVAHPDFALIIGFSRSMRAELDLDFAVCQTDTGFADPRVVEVFEHFQRRRTEDDNEEDVTPEMEYAIHDGQVHAGRYYPFKLSDEMQMAADDDEAVLVIGRPGRLDELEWQTCAARVPQDDEVEVEVCAVGLNNKDLSNALPTDRSVETATFGHEAVGTVRRLGSKTSGRLQIGDRVALIGTGTMATATTQSERHIVKLPPSVSLVDAATISLPYTTALHALLDVAHLKKGQTVLVHGAAGSPVGRAVMAVAHYLEAEVFVTVFGGQVDAQVQSLAFLPQHRIIHAQDAASLSDGILKATNGRGADLVLNATDPSSQSEDILGGTWRSMAQCGMFIDLDVGMRGDLLSRIMDNNKGNRGYTAIDMESVHAAKPAAVYRHLQRAFELYSEGHMAPLQPAKVFPAAEAAAAFAHLEQQKEAKIVIEFPKEKNTSILCAKEREIPISFDRNASYLIVGGLGDLGRQVALWLAAHGAGNIIFLSRNAGLAKKLEHATFFEELRWLGTGVQLVRASVTDQAAVTAALKSAALPVRGILQMSMVLKDRAFASTTYNDWQAVVEPKAHGTWNLHRAAGKARCPLDFFVMFGSISAVVGSPGQASYGAANAFLAAFARYRRGLGLPASTVEMGIVEDVGVAARDEALLRSYRAQGFAMVRLNDVLDALAVAIAAQPPKVQVQQDEGLYVDPATFVTGLGSAKPLTARDNRLLWRRDPRMAVYRNMAGSGAGGRMDDGSASVSQDALLKRFVSAARADKSVVQSVEAAALLAQAVGGKVLTLLGRNGAGEELDLRLSLADLGMDSLVSIEVRRWWKGALGWDVSMADLNGLGSLEMLGKYAAEKLCGILHGN